MSGSLDSTAQEAIHAVVEREQGRQSRGWKYRKKLKLNRWNRRERRREIYIHI